MSDHFKVESVCIFFTPCFGGYIEYYLFLGANIRGLKLFWFLLQQYNYFGLLRTMIFF
jgi:hypothetical protein